MLMHMPELNLHESKRTIQEHNAAILSLKPELNQLRQGGAEQTVQPKTVRTMTFTSLLNV